MTVLYVVLSVFPIIKVESVSTFAFKITLTIVVMNVVGAAIPLMAARPSGPAGAGVPSSN